MSRHFRLVTATLKNSYHYKNEGFDSPVKVHGAQKANLFYLLVINSDGLEYRTFNPRVVGSSPT